MRPDRRLNPDVAWSEMNALARSVAHATAQTIAEEIRARGDKQAIEAWGLTEPSEPIPNVGSVGPCDLHPKKRTFATDQGALASMLKRASISFDRVYRKDSNGVVTSTGIRFSSLDDEVDSCPETTFWFRIDGSLDYVAVMS
jgi:hypothetical protein